MKVKNFKNQKGFTLIELLVAMSLFVVVMMVGITALLSINEANKRANAVRLGVDTLNFALENMSRNIRLGTNFACLSDPNINTIVNHVGKDPEDCSTSSKNTLYFTSNIQNSSSLFDDIVYGLRNQSGVGQIFKLDPKTSFPNYRPLTSPNINITRLDFYVTGSQLNDGIQPRVRIVVEGRILVNSTKNEYVTVSAETTVTQRLLDS